MQATKNYMYSETVVTSHGKMQAWLLVEGPNYTVCLVEADNNDNVVEEYSYDNSLDAYDGWRELITSLKASH